MRVGNVKNTDAAVFEPLEGNAALIQAAMVPMCAARVEDLAHHPTVTAWAHVEVPVEDL